MMEHADDDDPAQVDPVTVPFSDEMDYFRGNDRPEDSHDED